MDVAQIELSQIISRGRRQGYLTYSEVSGYLPDQSTSPDELNNLIAAIENAGIELRASAPASSKHGPTAEELIDVDAEVEALKITSRPPRPGDDPIRTYLSQMAEIPLLSRDEEIAAPSESKSPASDIAARCSAATTLSAPQSTCSNASTQANSPSIARSKFRSPNS